MTQLQITVPREDTVRLPKESEKLVRSPMRMQTARISQPSIREDLTSSRNRFFKFSRI